MAHRHLQSLPGVALLLGLALSACGNSATVSPPATAEVLIPEQPVISLPLAGPITDPAAEISSMAWYGDALVILPQYPERFVGKAGPQLFVLPKSTIVEALDYPSLPRSTSRQSSSPWSRMDATGRRLCGWMTGAFW